MLKATIVRMRWRQIFRILVMLPRRRLLQIAEDLVLRSFAQDAPPPTLNLPHGMSMVRTNTYGRLSPPLGAVAEANENASSSSNNNTSTITNELDDDDGRPESPPAPSMQLRATSSSVRLEPPSPASAAQRNSLPHAQLLALVEQLAHTQQSMRVQVSGFASRIPCMCV